MKTLDEVIKGFECCQEINCAECPYVNRDNTDVMRCNDTTKEDDALYYLKAYKEMVDGVVNVICQYKETFKKIIEDCENEDAR